MKGERTNYQQVLMKGCSSFHPNLSWGKGQAKWDVLVWGCHTKSKAVDLRVPREAFLTAGSINRLRLRYYIFLAASFTVFGSPTPPHTIMRRALVRPPNLRWWNSWKQNFNWETWSKAFNMYFELLLEHDSTNLMFNGSKSFSKVFLQRFVQFVTCPLITSTWLGTFETSRIPSSIPPNSFNCRPDNWERGRDGTDLTPNYGHAEDHAQP
jgi:hypothetical protein